jgi:hypothetical protein
MVFAAILTNALDVKGISTRKLCQLMSNSDTARSRLGFLSCCNTVRLQSLGEAG